MGGGAREERFPSRTISLSSFSLLLSSLELSDTKVYEPQMRALLGTASHFCEVVDLKLSMPLSDLGAEQTSSVRPQGRKQPPPAFVRVVHLGRSTCHAISGRGG